VIVDDKLPLVNEKPFASCSRYAFAEKAYAKLRYCYKAILNVGIQQLILELTGRNSLKYLVENEKDKINSLQILEKHVEANDLVLLLGEGESDKKLKIDEQ
jgi:hypothetical protein